MAEKTRNSETLKDFTKYCEDNPDHRFWQALRNWGGISFLKADDVDTFYWEGRAE